MLPPRPRLSTTERHRLFELHGRTCHRCGVVIDVPHERWEIDHIVARAMKAPGCESEADVDQNMQPAHVKCHKGKTAQDAGALAKAKRNQAKAILAYRSQRPMPCGRDSRHKRLIGGRTVLRDAETQA